jgi:thiol-disulfide isomerase/thioredoxin
MSVKIAQGKVIPLFLALALTGTACSASPSEAQGQADQSETQKTLPPARFGEPLVVGGPMPNVNQQAGGPAEIDLDKVLGTEPVALYYWIAGNPRADEVFQQVQSIATEEGAAKLKLFGVVYLRTERDEKAVADRVVSLGIKVPVLNDVDFRLGQRLKIQSVPNVTLFDKEGRLRLTNGASIVEELEYKMDLGGAIRRVAETGNLGTYGYLSTYYPVKELVGHPCPDFSAPLLQNSVEQRWSDMMADDKVNVLIFWSVDCPHCRKSLPEINAWLKQNGAGMNVVSAAKVTNEATKIKTLEFCQFNEFVFPTLVDEDMNIATMFNVTSTPTILFIRPDGVIDSVMLNAAQDFGKTAEEKKKSLL